jgi:exonuclease III
MYNEYTSFAKESFRWAPVILSKFPVLDFDHSMSKYQLNYMKSHIKIGNKIICIDIFHPHPEMTEDQKANFINRVLEHNPTKLILAGDFNSLSPLDNYDKEKLLKGFETFMNHKAKDKVEDILKCQTVSKVLEKGLVDSFKEKNNDFKFTMPSDLRSKDKNSAIRIDYIFNSSDIKVIESGIIKSPLAEKSSDHYPTYAIFDI